MSDPIHRLSRGLPVLLAACLAACGGDASTARLTGEVRRLTEELQQVRAQAQQAQDYIAVANLQAAYGYYSDKALWDQAADLFSREATLEIAGRGVFVGNARIRQYLSSLPGLTPGTVFLHLQLQPVIHVAPDGRTAQGRWRSLVQIGQLGRRSQIGEGIYENAYVKEDGVWKISSLHFYNTYLVNHQDAWLKPGEPLLGPFPNLPPDRPPSVKYESYPGVFVPPFHYPNPVSGRP